jgi:two-component system sensor histidine kinase PhoQ
VHETILTRGARADTANAGQGIGLAVAVDILSSYGGSLEITTATLGGAGFILRLPYKT